MCVYIYIHTHTQPLARILQTISHTHTLSFASAPPFSAPSSVFDLPNAHAALPCEACMRPPPPPHAARRRDQAKTRFCAAPSQPPARSSCPRGLQTRETRYPAHNAPIDRGGTGDPGKAPRFCACHGAPLVQRHVVIGGRLSAFCGGHGSSVGTAPRECETRYAARAACRSPLVTNTRPPSSRPARAFAGHPSFPRRQLKSAQPPRKPADAHPEERTPAGTPAVDNAPPTADTPHASSRYPHSEKRLPRSPLVMFFFLIFFGKLF